MSCQTVNTPLNVPHSTVPTYTQNVSQYLLYCQCDDIHPHPFSPKTNTQKAPQKFHQNVHHNPKINKETRQRQQTFKPNKRPIKALEIHDWLKSVSKFTQDLLNYNIFHWYENYLSGLYMKKYECRLSSLFFLVFRHTSGDRERGKCNQCPLKCKVLKNSPGKILGDNLLFHSRPVLVE